MQTMQDRLQVGFVAGLLGALILGALMTIMSLITGEPSTFAGVYAGIFGAEAATATAWILGALLFAVAGGIWGCLYTALVNDPNIGNGMLFGILPTLWQWLVVAPLMGDSLFFGFAAQSLIIPIIANVIIWGSFVGWYCDQRITAPAATRGAERRGAERRGAETRPAT